MEHSAHYETQDQERFLVQELVKHVSFSRLTVRRPDKPLCNIARLIRRQGAPSGKCRDTHSQDFEEALFHGVHQDPDQIQRCRLFWVTEITQR
jgi:hypothetical protein